jgi:DNA-binding CsgD family transcriptional regulator
MNTGNMTMVYGAVAVLSVLLLIGYFLIEKKKERNFIFLISCVAIVNTGYFLLAAANSLPMAMFANGVSYFGAAYSMLAMLLIISDVCQMKKRMWAKILFISISTAAFLLAASGDWLGLYYTSVDITSVGGITKLVKEYGPLHILYTAYLLSYVLIMVAIIWYAAKKQRLSSFKYTMLLFVAVLLNIGVWAVEQCFNEDFEFLSVSYVVTEIILLLLYSMLRDYGIVQPGGQVISVQMLTQLNTQRITPGALPPGIEDLFQTFAEKVKNLSFAERRILNYYIEGHDTADIPDLAFISIHTVKKHNHSIYQKLGVASRDELMLYIELFRCCDRLGELTDVQEETELS